MEVMVYVMWVVGYFAVFALLDAKNDIRSLRSWVQDLQKSVTELERQVAKLNGFTGIKK